MKIYGRKPVLEALKSKAPLTKIYIQFGTRGEGIDAIKTMANKQLIPLQELPSAKFVQLVDRGKETQGVFALRAEFKTYKLEDLIEKFPVTEHPVFLALDSIQDPHNVGAILRTAEAAGVNGVIITKHNSAPLNDTVMKSSAGAVEMVKVALVDNLAQALQVLKEKGYWVVGTSLKAEKSHREIDYTMPLVIVMGSEGKGMRPLIERHCDFLVKIPMRGKINSLNVSVATGIILFEAVKDRKQ